jgi:hypothetical protein
VWVKVKGVWVRGYYTAVYIRGYGLGFKGVGVKGIWVRL